MKKAKNKSNGTERGREKGTGKLKKEGQRKREKLFLTPHFHEKD